MAKHKPNGIKPHNSQNSLYLVSVQLSRKRILL